MHTRGTYGSSCVLHVMRQLYGIQPSGRKDVRLDYVAAVGCSYRMFHFTGNVILILIPFRKNGLKTCVVICN